MATANPKGKPRLSKFESYAAANSKEVHFHLNKLTSVSSFVSCCVLLIAHRYIPRKYMAKFGYEKRKVMRKVQSFRHFSCVSVLYQRNTRVAYCARCYSRVSLV